MATSFALIWQLIAEYRSATYSNIGLNVTKTLQKLSLLSRSCFLQNAHLYFQILSTMVVVSLSRQQLPYPMSRGYIFAVWAVMEKVASADNRSIFYQACAKFVRRFTSKINHQVCPHGQMAWVSEDKKKLRQLRRQLWADTQDSLNALNQSRTGKNPFF